MESTTQNTPYTSPITPAPRAFEEAILRRTFEVNPVLRSAFDIAFDVDAESQTFDTDLDRVRYVRNAIFIATALEFDNERIHDFVVYTMNLKRPAEDELDDIIRDAYVVFNPDLGVPIFCFDIALETEVDDRRALFSEVTGLLQQLYDIKWLIDDTSIYKTTVGGTHEEVFFMASLGDDAYRERNLD